MAEDFKGLSEECGVCHPPILEDILADHRLHDGLLHVGIPTLQILLWKRPAYFNGLKSGFTIEGGKCLIASAKHNGREILIVLLGSTQEEVFRDAKRLFRWYEKQVKTNAVGDSLSVR